MSARRKNYTREEDFFAWFGEVGVFSIQFSVFSIRFSVFSFQWEVGNSEELGGRSEELRTRRGRRLDVPPQHPVGGGAFDVPAVVADAHIGHKGWSPLRYILAVTS